MTRSIPGSCRNNVDPAANMLILSISELMGLDPARIRQSSDAKVWTFGCRRSAHLWRPRWCGTSMEQMRATNRFVSGRTCSSIYMCALGVDSFSWKVIAGYVNHLTSGSACNQQHDTPIR